MPLYSYKCQACNTAFDDFAPMAKSAEPQFCRCGKLANRVITPTRISKDYDGYQCPVTDQWISGRRAHEENLKRQGCRVLEPGEKETNEQKKIRAEADFEKRLDQTVEKAIDSLPSEKKEKLANELSAGTDLSVDRA